MHILRRLLLVLIVPIFFLVIIGLAINIGFERTAGDKQFVKQVIATSGIYGSVTNQLLDQGKKSVGPYGTSVSLNDPQVRQVAQQVFSPQVVQKNTEIVIDSLYAWLEGNTTEPDFKIDLTAQKAELADKISALAAQKAATLTACPAGYVSTSFDAFTATCLPTGVTPEAIGNTVKTDIQSGSGLLDNPVFTSQSLKSDSGQNPFTKPEAKNVSKAYQAAKKAPFGLVLAALLIALVILFLASTKKTGLRTIGIVILIAGILILIWAGLGKTEFNSRINKIILDNKVLQLNVRTLAREINAEVSKNSLIIGGLYSALGVTAIAISIMIKDKTVKLEPAPLQPEPKVQPIAPPPKKPKRYKKISL